MTNPETHHDEHHSSLKDKIHHLADKITHHHHVDKGKQPAVPQDDHAVSTTVENQHHTDNQADPVAEHPIVHKSVGDHPGNNLGGVGIGNQVI
ncbi:hypothetical protein BGW41_002633 [Actinomortierella wolfii]|nr:hypothetical protein BGW41_002633 [Actinomortierella wolfii]